MADDSSDDGHSSDWKESPKIVIIGAGISGIAAAVKLYQEGFTDFVVLEASDRIGGRIWSIDLESEPGRKAELGANWVHGLEENPIWKLAVDHELVSRRDDYIARKLGEKIIFKTEDAESVNPKLVKEVDFHFGMLMASCEMFYQDSMPTPVENDSVGAYVEREYSRKATKYTGSEFTLRKKIFKQRLMAEAIIAGADNMYEVSLSEMGSFHEIPGVHYVIPNGFEEVIQILKQKIPADKILLQHVVSHISWERSNRSGASEQASVCVQCQNGKEFYASHVVCTMPLGYLKKNVGRLFNPPLPEFKLSAIDRLGMGTVNKVVLQFGPGTVLPEGVIKLEMVWDREDSRNADLGSSWYKKIPYFDLIAENTLVGWLTGREAEYIETLSDQEVGKKCCEIINQFLGNSHNLPTLLKTVCSKWSSLPYILGSYSFIPVGCHVDEVEAMQEPVLNQDSKAVLFFAGEATHPSFYSSSHGALLSGRREAERIIQLHCPDTSSH